MLFLILLCVLGKALTDENILCTNDYCKDVQCPELSEKCKAQNSTHNGVFMTPPTTCNCCQYCIDNLNEGEECSIGGLSDPMPTEMCGPGLFCKPVNINVTDGFCSIISSDCTLLQNDYDKRKAAGTLGTMEVRQECDDEGDFVPYKCIPGQTCYCVNSKGHRIFGESDYTSMPKMELKCKCSRDYDVIKEIIEDELTPFQYFHCASNGDYDTVQCIGDQCLCADSYDGAPTYPNDDTVNITDISETTLKCYKKKEPGLYYQKCELEYLEALERYNKLMENNYMLMVGFEFPQCDLDGTYKAVQENKTHRYCVDKDGTVLTGVLKTNSAAKNMDCNCVRANLVMTTTEKPTCSPNGSYTPKQCRKGRCRCVDNNGNQVCKKSTCEVDEIDTLRC